MAKKTETFNFAELQQFTDSLPQGTKLSPEILWRFGRIGGASVNAEGVVLYGVANTNIKANKSFTNIFYTPANASKSTLLANTPYNEQEVRWHPDGKHYTFLAAGVNGCKTPQVYMADFSKPSEAPTQLTNVKGGVETYIISPDGQSIVYVNRVELDQKMTDRHPDMPKSTARLETDLMYRHWNDWADGSYNHPFWSSLQNGIVTKGTDLLEGQKFHSPLMPFGGAEELAVSHNGQLIAYTCKKLQGMQSAMSTNSNIYIYNTLTGETSCISAENKGYDKCPQFSADDKSVYWLSMETDGYESDQNRIVRRAINADGTPEGDMQNLFANTELFASQFILADSLIYFIAPNQACETIFALNTENNDIKAVTNHTADYVAIAGLRGNNIVALRQSMFSPTEAFCVSTATGEAEQISDVNSALLAKLNMGSCTANWVNTTDGKQMLVWHILPPDFDQSKKYPALLYCQGGPQSTVSQFWSNRWNFALMAANGYVVVAPNRRGLPGFGIEWNKQISGDYGGQNIKDYFSAIDHAATMPYVNKEALGAVGASYGGYSVYHLAGKHNKRFKAFIAHCGIYNLESMYSTTEEMFFVQHDLKGAPWEKDNAAAMHSYSASPHLFAADWDTPIMVIHGEKDFRIPYTQGMGAFNTAVLRGIPAQFLYFPDECHWVSTPQNSIVWHREFFMWLDKWLKD